MRRRQSSGDSLIVSIVGALLFTLAIVYIQNVSLPPDAVHEAPLLRQVPTEPRTPKHILNHTTSPPTSEQKERLESIRNAMQFAYSNYETYAFGADEVGPVSGGRKSHVWGGLAMTMIDSLGTLWLMGFRDEFWRAREYIAANLTLDHWKNESMPAISVFETTIRAVGGLLSAYELSEDRVFVDKAQMIMEELLHAFDIEAGVFASRYKTSIRAGFYPAEAGLMAAIADIGTLQLETRLLSHVTEVPKYAQMGEAFYGLIRKLGSYKDTGLFPSHYNPPYRSFVHRTKLTFGAYADSFYEYLLKVYVFSGQRPEDQYLKDFYNDAIRGLEETLLFYSKHDELYVVHDLIIPEMNAVLRMEHLTCFVPGMLAYGTVWEQNETTSTKHLDLAKKIADTCYELYVRQPSGLAPDVVTFPLMYASKTEYRLRPEMMESLFYLYRVTGDTKYRDQGWEIFQSIEKHCRTTYGYGSVKDVTTKETQVEDVMESFFLSETLKYAYLLQAPETLLPLDEYVFNTEGHVFRVQGVENK